MASDIFKLVKCRCVRARGCSHPRGQCPNATVGQRLYAGKWQALCEECVRLPDDKPTPTRTTKRAA